MMNMGTALRCIIMMTGEIIIVLFERTMDFQFVVFKIGSKPIAGQGLL